MFVFFARLLNASIAYFHIAYLTPHFVKYIAQKKYRKMHQPGAVEI